MEDSQSRNMKANKMGEVLQSMKNGRDATASAQMRALSSKS